MAFFSNQLDPKLDTALLALLLIASGALAVIVAVLLFRRCCLVEEVFRSGEDVHKKLGTPTPVKVSREPPSGDACFRVQGALGPFTWYTGEWHIQYSANASGKQNLTPLGMTLIYNPSLSETGCFMQMLCSQAQANQNLLFPVAVQQADGSYALYAYRIEQDTQTWFRWVGEVTSGVDQVQTVNGQGKFVELADGDLVPEMNEEDGGRASYTLPAPSTADRLATHSVNGTGSPLR